MALHSRRFSGKALLQPNYNFRDVPWCAHDLSGSTLSVVTERQHLVDSIAEITLLCNEATRRQKRTVSNSSRKTTKPLSVEYIFDRFDTDDPLWGLMVRTDTPTSFKGRMSNTKASPQWRRGMLQGVITMTTFTNWQSSFCFDSLNENAFQDDSELDQQMRSGLRKYDSDGSLAEELEACVKGGNPHEEGIVYPRIAELALLGGLGCGKQLLKLLVEHLEHLKASAHHNYDYVVLQATENSISFYEAMGFIRVGCVQGKVASPNKYHSGPVEEYHTKKNGETPASVATDFGVDVWDIIFLNKPMYSGLVQRSWLKSGTILFVPKNQKGVLGGQHKWYFAKNNETPRGIARKFHLDCADMLSANKRRYPDLEANSKLMKGTRMQISRFDIDEGDTIAYSHWCFPDAVQDEEDEPSYMMAMRLKRKKWRRTKGRDQVKPVEDSIMVSIQPYSPEASGAKDLLLEPKLAPAKKNTRGELKKPKRSTSSYIYFLLHARTIMAEELKGLTFGDTNKILSEKWKAMSDDEKAPFQKQAAESKANFNKAMEEYKAEMDRRQISQNTIEPGQVDTSLLEKVVKLKSVDGICGASKFDFFYVLTFIPDLQWVHLIPLRKVGFFGPEYPTATGRPIWMVEDEGKEIDTHASVCQPVTAFMMKGSADADDEQWDIYDIGDKSPTPRTIPESTLKTEAPLDDRTAKRGHHPLQEAGREQAPLSTCHVPKSVANATPGAPIKPKRPANSFALFCSDANQSMKDQLKNKSIAERSRILAEYWKGMTDQEKKKYQDQRLELYARYSEALKQYEEDLAQYQSENPVTEASTVASSKTPKSMRKDKSGSEILAPVSSKTVEHTKVDSSSEKKKRGQQKDLMSGMGDGLAPVSSKTAEHTKIDNSSEKKKRGQQKDLMSGTGNGDETPAPKRGRPKESNRIPTTKGKTGRPRESPPPVQRQAASISLAEIAVGSAEKNPVALENYLGKLKDGQQIPGSVLSFINEEETPHRTPLRNTIQCRSSQPKATEEAPSLKKGKKSCAPEKDAVSTPRLAPIFLKDYAKKKHDLITENNSPKKSSGRPARKRKLASDDKHVVSDDADTSIAKAGRKRKRAKTNRSPPGKFPAAKRRTKRGAAAAAAAAGIDGGEDDSPAAKAPAPRKSPSRKSPSAKSPPRKPPTGRPRRGSSAAVGSQDGKDAPAPRKSPPGKSARPRRGAAAATAESDGKEHNPPAAE